MKERKKEIGAAHGGRGEEGSEVQYIDNRLLASNRNFQAFPCDFDNQVAPPQVRGHGYGDVDVGDGLRPFVREEGLLRGFFGRGGGVGAGPFGGGGEGGMVFWRWVGWLEWCEESRRYTPYLSDI